MLWVLIRIASLSTLFLVLVFDDNSGIIFNYSLYKYFQGNQRNHFLSIREDSNGYPKRMRQNECLKRHETPSKSGLTARRKDKRVRGNSKDRA